MNETHRDTQKNYRKSFNQSHCAKVQKYEQGKIGLQFFDMWYRPWYL